MIIFQLTISKVEYIRYGDSEIRYTGVRWLGLKH